MRRSFILLAGACVVAGGAAMLGGDDRAPAASINGAPLTGSPVATASAANAVPAAKPSTPEEAAAFEALAEEPREVTQAQPARPPLGTLIDLDRIERVDDHYEAPLKDGRRAVLTLDPDLQPLAEKLLNESRAPRAGIVVMAPDGRVLALAGRRTDEPSGGKEGTFDWRLATDVWAPAASIFKLVTAAALVQQGVEPEASVCYHGGVRSVMESNLTDSKKDGRCEDLTYGVAHSQNAIMGKLAYQKLVPEQLDKMARTVGFTGALPGKELPGNAGVITIPEERNLEFAKTAAGFLNSQLSVAGGALLATTFANGGEQPVPRLIASIDGVEQKAGKPKRVLPEKIARAVGRMMTQTCEKGSAAKIFSRKRTTTVAGKTGTLTRTEPFYMEHSWFVGFAPADKPEIVVSVLFGNPESWWLRGHEGAKRLIDRFMAVRDDATSRGKDRTAALERTKRP